MKYCSACGNEVVDTAVICPKCGSPVAANASIPTEFPTWAVWVGWIGAVVMPLVGIAFGIWALVKKKVGMGVAMILVSILAWAMWAAIMAPSAPELRYY